METIRRISNAVSRVLQRVEMFVGCSCLALMLALMLTNAIARYLFDFPIVWSDELNNFSSFGWGSWPARTSWATIPTCPSPVWSVCCRGGASISSKP